MANKYRQTIFNYVPSHKEKKCMSLCNKNGLVIYPIPQNDFGSVYKLHVHGDGYDVVGKTEYDSTKDVWYKAIYRQYVKLKEKENYE